MEERANSLFNVALDQMTGQLGTKATFNDDLHKMGKRYFGKQFRGVFSADTVPKMKKGECCIANLDKKGQPGSHWVALARNGKHYLFFDSFGRHHTQIIPSIKGLGKIKDTDLDVDQHYSQLDCGPRCLAWLCLNQYLGEKWSRLI